MKNSFRIRLFSYILAVSLIPLLICIALMMHLARLQMNARTRESVASHSAIVTGAVDDICEGFQAAFDALQDSFQVQCGLTGSMDSLLEVDTALFYATEASRSFAVFQLYDTDGICRYSTEGAPAEEPRPTGWGLLHSAASRPGEAVYLSTDVNISTSAPLLEAARQIRDSDGHPTGYLVMRIYFWGFRHLLEGMTPKSDVILLSSFFHPVFSSQSYLNETLVPELRAQLLRGEDPGMDDYLYSVTRHPGTGLYLVLRQPWMFSGSTLWMLYTAGLLCTLICLLLSVGLSFAVSHQISLPLRRLQQAFDKVRQADLDVHVEVHSEDELGNLAIRFNNMVDALRENRDQLLRNQQELKEAQIRMMQAQLNPHFLGNTLDTMKWISKINKVPQVALMSTNLADIVRFSISSQELVPLYRDIEILERYIEIQKIRLSDDFSFSMQIQEELYDCMVPKMLLQPLVENAILHGLNGMSGSVIRVTADFSEPGYFHITVSDNGKGFPPEMVGKPYHGDKNLAKGHLGLYNVHTILTKYYGEKCGLYLDCGEGGIGASVTATLPIHYEEETEC